MSIYRYGRKLGQNRNFGPKSPKKHQATAQQPGPLPGGSVGTCYGSAARKNTAILWRFGLSTELPTQESSSARQHRFDSNICVRRISWLSCIRNIIQRPFQPCALMDKTPSSARDTTILLDHFFIMLLVFHPKTLQNKRKQERNIKQTKNNDKRSKMTWTMSQKKRKLNQNICKKIDYHTPKLEWSIILDQWKN